MLNGLIQSKTRIKLLSLFLTQEGKRFYSRELVKLTGEHYNAIWRELVHLEKIGLLSGENSNNIKYYSVNKKFPLFAELKSMIVKANGSLLKDVKDLTNGIDQTRAAVWKGIANSK